MQFTSNHLQFYSVLITEKITYLYFLSSYTALLMFNFSLYPLVFRALKLLIGWQERVSSLVKVLPQQTLLKHLPKLE